MQRDVWSLEASKRSHAEQGGGSHERGQGPGRQAPPSDGIQVHASQVVQHEPFGL